VATDWTSYFRPTAPFEEWEEADEWCEEHGHQLDCPHDPTDYDVGAWD